MDVKKWLKGSWRWVVSTLPWTGGLVLAHDDAVTLHAEAKRAQCQKIRTLCPSIVALNDKDLFQAFRRSREFTMLDLLHVRSHVTCRILRRAVYEKHGWNMSHEDHLAGVIDLWRNLELVAATGIEKHTLQGDPTGEWTPSPNIGLTSPTMPRFVADPVRGGLRELPPTSVRTLNDYVTAALTDKGRQYIADVMAESIESGHDQSSEQSRQ